MNWTRINLPPTGSHLPKRNSRFLRFFGCLLLATFGWKFNGAFPLSGEKFVVIGGPHTSGWDLFLSLAMIWALDLKVSWMSKHTIFWWPLGAIWRYFGGIPVDRTASHGVVDQMVDEFNRHDRFIVAIMPEGTRKRVEKWRTGFYHIAHKANVPIVPIILDFGRKTIRICPATQPSDEIEAHIAHFMQLFASAQGANPHRRLANQ